MNKRFYTIILQSEYTVCIEDNPINYIINKKQIQTIKNSRNQFEKYKEKDQDTNTKGNKYK